MNVQEALTRLLAAHRIPLSQKEAFDVTLLILDLQNSRETESVEKERLQDVLDDALSELLDGDDYNRDMLAILRRGQSNESPEEYD